MIPSATKKINYSQCFSFFFFIVWLIILSLKHSGSVLTIYDGTSNQYHQINFPDMDF